MVYYVFDTFLIRFVTMAQKKIPETTLKSRNREFAKRCLANLLEIFLINLMKPPNMAETRCISAIAQKGWSKLD